jgi:hypothetical protein
MAHSASGCVAWLYAQTTAERKPTQSKPIISFGTAQKYHFSTLPEDDQRKPGAREWNG